MIKSIYFPTKEYPSKEELFKDMRANKDEIISLKKADIQKSCEKGTSVTCKSLPLSKFTDEQQKMFRMDDSYWYVVVNSTRILDCHDDLHVDGIWRKSINENQGKNYLVADHDLELEKVIVKKAYIEMFTAKIPFSVIGKPYVGDTEVLVYKFPKDKVINQVAKDWLESGDEIEASVRMQYVTILFAMDSNAPEDATEKKNYDDYIGYIANKDEFEYIPYFFIIKEAKNVRESSLVVFGSNSATGVVVRNKVEPTEVTQQKEEPTPVTLAEQTKKVFIN